MQLQCRHSNVLEEGNRHFGDALEGKSGWAYDIRERIFKFQFTAKIIPIPTEKYILTVTTGHDRETLWTKKRKSSNGKEPFTI